MLDSFKHTKVWQYAAVFTVSFTVSVQCAFLPARRYASAGLCDSDVSVCPSVWTSVTRRYCAYTAERKQDREVYTFW